MYDKENNLKEDFIFYILVIPFIFLLSAFLIENSIKESIIRECQNKKYYKITSRNFVKCEVIIYNDILKNKSLN
jgi:hypothetical protein